ncbi:MAG: CD225/dispanin family protein [Victivallaceae bacterium]|nr:CD225/dispanin family protein [Victivallaceae bacterium]
MMFCTKCGAENADGAKFCTSCGAAMDGGQKPIVIKSYLVESILITVLCCLPFGIVGIVYAFKVSGLVAAGNYSAAQEAAGKAKFWTWLGFGFGIVWVILWVGFQVVGASSQR